MLGLDVNRQGAAGSPMSVPVFLAYFDTTITALVFSLDINGEVLAFDPTDDDMDGIPDSVTLPSGLPSVIYIDFDPDDDDGEIDVMLVNLSGAPLPRGVIIRFTFEATQNGPISNWLRFSDDPQPSFGNAQGQNVEGTLVYFRQRIFADGFESGDTSAWTRQHGIP